MRKRLKLITILMIMVFTLSACAGPVGYYRLRTVSSGTITMTEEDARALQLDPGSVKLCKSGRCELDLLGEKLVGTWKIKDDKLIVESKGKTFKGKIKNDTVVLKDEAGTKYKFSMEKLL